MNATADRNSQIIYWHRELPPLDAPRALGLFGMSAAARTGLDELLAAWWSELLSLRSAAERVERDAAFP